MVKFNHNLNIKLLDALKCKEIKSMDYSRKLARIWELHYCNARYFYRHLASVNFEKSANYDIINLKSSYVVT